MTLKKVLHKLLVLCAVAALMTMSVLLLRKLPPTSIHVNAQGPNTFCASNVACSVTAPWQFSNVYNMNGVFYVDGTQYATVQQAQVACPATTGVGCVIDMRGNSNSTALNIGAWDPGYSATNGVTLLLGPYTYTASITLRMFLHVIGMGYGETNVNQMNASSPIFKLPTTSGAAYPATVAQNVHVEGMTLNPYSGSTSDAISIVAAAGQSPGGGSSSGGGLWYSSFDHIYIQPGFGRNDIRIDGSQAWGPDSAGQFLTFRDVWAFRQTNGPPVLYISGSYVGQMTFSGVEFDQQYGGQDTSSNLSNIYIDDAPGPNTCPGGGQCYLPYSITFENMTSQFANGPGGVAIRAKGIQTLICTNCHFEGDIGVISVEQGPGGHTNSGIVFTAPFMATSAIAADWSGVPANSGYIVNINAVNQGAPGYFPAGTVTFTGANFFGTPDHVCTTAVNGSSSVSGCVGFDQGIQSFVNSCDGLPPAFGALVTVAQLPNVAYYQGQTILVKDSTAVTTQGQTCAGSSSHTAKAFSDGSTWHCSQ